MAARYKIMSLSSEGGPTATRPVQAAIAAIAKKNTETDPYIIVNEFICNHLARAVMLPCPPGALFDSDEQTYFFSLDFNLAGEALPPIDPSLVVTTHREFAWGTILFDCLVLNEDRHSMNIAHDQTSDQVQIFDHSHAFLGAGRRDVAEHLANNQESLGIGGHCLATAINHRHGLEKWASRIAQIPDFFIEELVQQSERIGLPSDHLGSCSDFLKFRRSNLLELVHQNRPMFPLVEDWG